MAVSLDVLAAGLENIRFMTVAEIAKLMRVSKGTVYRLIQSGELESIRFGRSYRVPEQVVNEYMRSAKVVEQGSNTKD
jgi:excisionase family DNA binding protein